MSRDVSETGKVTRTRAPRRKLSLGRGAVLMVDGRPHIVALADLSVTGAYVATRTRLKLGQVLGLNLIPSAGRTELKLRARVVRIAQEAEESPQHLRGAAVCFEDIDNATRALLSAFVGVRPPSQAEVRA